MTRTHDLLITKERPGKGAEALKNQGFAGIVAGRGLAELRKIAQGEKTQRTIYGTEGVRGALGVIWG